MNPRLSHLKTMSSVTSEQITTSCKSLKLIQSQNVIFTQVAEPNAANITSLVFASTDELLQKALKQDALGLIIPEKLLPQIQSAIGKNKSLWTTTNIHMSMSEVLKLFNCYQPMNSGIHPTAAVDASAVIGKNVVVEAYVVIGKNVTVGDNCIIGAHSVLENNASVGTDSRLSAQVFLGHNCHIGNNCIIGPQNVFGSEGYGFVTDKLGHHHKVPQIGNVIIEDNCEFGAFCAIDRATITETRICKGSKFDNFIHIAHNCEIGENALITAGFIVAGSTKIGKQFMAAGNSGVLGHLTVTDNVVLSARTGVTSSITKPGIYGGYPHVEQKENLKIMTSLQSLPRLRKSVTKILKHLGLEE